MVIKTTLEQRGPTTDEERAMLEKTRTLPVSFDEDYLELTAEGLKGFRCVNRNESRNRP